MKDVDTLNRSTCLGAAWRALVETYTPHTEGTSKVVLDGIDNFRVSCEKLQ